MRSNATKPAPETVPDDSYVCHFLHPIYLGPEGMNFILTNQENTTMVIECDALNLQSISWPSCMILSSRFQILLPKLEKESGPHFANELLTKMEAVGESPYGDSTTESKILDKMFISLKSIVKEFVQKKDSHLDQIVIFLK